MVSFSKIRQAEEKPLDYVFLSGFHGAATVGIQLDWNIKRQLKRTQFAVLKLFIPSRGARSVRTDEFAL